MNEFCPSLPGTSQFVHSFVHFVMTFSVIIPWQHVIWCQKWWYELLGPWPICPPSFIEISWKMSEISPLFNTKTFTTTTTSIIIIIAKMKPHNNKIPFPFWGNGITRGTVPRGTVDPIPNGLSLWPRTIYRHVWDYCQSGIIARVAL